MKKGWINSSILNYNRFLLLFFVLVLMVISVNFVMAATIEVSQPTQITSNSYYERGQSIVYDGTNYWLFYGRSTDETGNYDSGTPDDNNYEIYYKKATTISDLAGAAATAVTGADNIYQGQTSAVYYGGNVWVFAADETSNDHSIKAWHTTDGTSWTEHDTGIDGCGAPHLLAIVYDNKIFLAYNAVGGKIQIVTYNGSSWSSPIDASINEGMPRFYVDGSDLYMFWVSWGMPAYYIHKYNSGWSTTPDYSIAGTSDDDCDPFLVKVGSDYVFIFAPWDGTQQFLKYWDSSSVAGFDGLDQSSAKIMTGGKYSATPWVDMWPVAISDGSDVYVFYTSEASGTTRGTGNIFMLKFDWTIGNDHYNYIQNAIDASASGTINVAAGTYEEQITINKDLTLTGAGASTTTIQAPASMGTVNVRGGTQAIQGVVNVIGASAHEINVNINGFTIDGNYQTPASSSTWFAGIVHSNADGTIEDNIITKTKQEILGGDAASWRGHGIWVGDASTVTINNNEISEWQRNGIEIRDAAATATITNNILTGMDTTPSVSNGITFYGATDGTVSGNTVTGCKYTGSGSGNDFYGGTQACAIISYDGLGIFTVSNNTVINNDMGIYSRLNSVGNITGNIIEDNLYFGIVFRKGDVTATYNTITGGEIGIFIPSTRPDTGIAPVANNNNIDGNTLFGVKNDAAYLIDAEKNYWGSLDGPGGEGPGTGDGVSTDVDYSPWLSLPVGSVPMTYGVDDTSTIQEIIDLANPGDTIYVSDGVYNGGIVINKSIRLIGAGYSSTSVIDCLGGGTGVLINSSNTVVSGFKIINCDNGIDIQGKTNTIINNSFNSNVNGIKVSKALNNKINFNVIEGNTKFGVNNTDTDFVNATLNYWGSCDGPGGAGNGRGDNVSIRVDFNPWIGVCIHNKTNVECKYETDNITLSANISSSLDISVWVSYTINGTNHNVTVANPVGGIYSYILKSTQLTGGMNVTWNYYANDSFGNLFNNSWKTFYVRNRTNLIVAPPTPDGLNNWYITEPLFTLIKDSAGGNVYYRWDAAGAVLYALPFGLENIPNPPKQTAGTLELNWWTDFMACENEPEQTRMFHIDLTNPVIKDLNPANNSIVYNNLRPNISAYLDEVYGTNSGINLISVIMKLDGNAVSPNVNTADTIDAIVSYISTTDLSLGKHNVTVNVTDNASRNSELTWFFAVNESPPFMMFVNSPQDGIYGTRRIPFNISLNTTVKILEYINHDDRRPRWRRLCSNCDGHGTRRESTKTLGEGNNNITIRAEDNFGNVEERNISLFIDSKLPRIIKTLPGRNKVTNGTGFYIKYSEDNLQKVELFWNGSKTLTCTSGVNQECATDADLSAYDGEEIEYYFNVTDLVRTVESRRTKVKVDTTVPELTINSPKNNTNHSSRVLFNITVGEDVLLEYYDKSRPRWRRLCGNCDDYGNSRKKLKYFRKGSYDLLIRATDKAGQSDVEEVSFSVV